MRNTFAHLPVPTIRPVEDQSGGAPAASGGEATANGDSEKELRSGHSSGCQSNRGLRRCYLTAEEEQKRTEQLRRREAATALKTKTRRRRPGRRQHARVIKMGPRPPPDASRERNREEKVSPELETKSDSFGRKRGNSKSAPTCKVGSKSKDD